VGEAHAAAAALTDRSGAYLLGRAQDPALYCDLVALADHALNPHLADLCGRKGQKPKLRQKEMDTEGRPYHHCSHPYRVPSCGKS
jgi:hypothetical protein